MRFPLFIAMAAILFSLTTQKGMAQEMSKGKSGETTHKVFKTDAEWQSCLSPEAFAVTRKKKHRATFFREILRFLAKRCLCLRGLRQQVVLLRNQIRFRKRLAQLLGCDRQKGRSFEKRLQLGYGTYGNSVRHLRRPSGPCF